METSSYSLQTNVKTSTGRKTVWIIRCVRIKTQFRKTGFSSKSKVKTKLFALNAREQSRKTLAEGLIGYKCAQMWLLFTTSTKLSRHLADSKTASSSSLSTNFMSDHNFSLNLAMKLQRLSFQLNLIWTRNFRFLMSNPINLQNFSIRTL